MIYYFSGTGNSEFVAVKLAEYTKDDCAFIPDVFANMTSDIQVAEGEVIGVVCPIYAWGVPECVADFLTHVKVDPKAFAYIVATCGSSAGKALKAIEKIFPYNSAYSVRMPENCIPLFKTDSAELTREKINVARQLLPRIAQSVVVRTEAYDVKEGFEASFKTAVINPLFTSFFMRTSRFKVSDACTSCGTCAAVCPFGIIAMTGDGEAASSPSGEEEAELPSPAEEQAARGVPSWQSDRCQMCMRCVMACPTRALRIGASARHEVYLFPADLMTQGGVRGSVVHEKAEPTIPMPAAGAIPITEGESVIAPRYAATDESGYSGTLTGKTTPNGGTPSLRAEGEAISSHTDRLVSTERATQGGTITMTNDAPNTKVALLADIAQLERTVADLRRRVEGM